MAIENAAKTKNQTYTAHLKSTLEQELQVLTTALHTRRDFMLYYKYKRNYHYFYIYTYTYACRKGERCRKNWTKRI